LQLGKVKVKILSILKRAAARFYYVFRKEFGHFKQCCGSGFIESRSRVLMTKIEEKIQLK
jgi:hypothetical protein